MNELPLRTKLFYAMGGLGMNLPILVISQWLFVEYAPSGGTRIVPASLLAVSLLVGRIIDAVTDPLVGHWSDRHVGSRGRRIPFLRAGVVPFALVLALLWIPPSTRPSVWTTLWVLGLVQLFYLFYAVMITPYLALLADLTRDSTQRVQLATLQAVFITVGAVAFSGVGPLVHHAGWTAMGIAVATLAALSFVPSAFVLREPAVISAPRESPPFWKSFRAALRDRAFLSVVIATSLYLFGLNLVLMVLPFWVELVLHESKDAVAWVMVPFLVTNGLSFAAFNAGTRRYGKPRMFLLALVGSGVTIPLLALVGRVHVVGLFTQTQIVVGLVGLTIGGLLALPYALLSDVIDADERASGARRGALYFGVQALFQKPVMGLAAIAFTFLLYLGGTVPSVTGMRWIAVVAGLACLVGAMVFRGYPLADSSAR